MENVFEVGKFDVLVSHFFSASSHVQDPIQVDLKPSASGPEILPMVLTSFYLAIIISRREQAMHVNQQRG
jgi:hypothetical protein